MILHNLKVACRNLMKYRTQNIVSIVALAVGIVTLAATHFVLKHVGPPSIANESYYDRCYVMGLYDEKTAFDATEFVSAKVLRTICKVKQVEI